ncbi:MAG: hypothetical protein V1494_01970 [Candidatus Diapherotrites archaeon]
MIPFNKIMLLALAFLVLGTALALMVWLTQFQNAFLMPGLLSQLNPIGWLAVIAILVFGGIYLLKISFSVFSGFFRGD